MKAYIDLHIHSSLSPCSDKDMTPNNIVNMAYLKGLDIIAVTDHNSAENCDAMVICGKKRGIIVVPGMELETREEVHLVCLFPSVAEAHRMQEIVYNALPDIENREDIFGQQIMMDEEDNISGYQKRLLLTASSLSIDDAFMNVSSLGGVVIPAHVDRDSYSMISNLGIIPKTPKMKYIEVSRTCYVKRFVQNNPYLKEFNIIRSSDAHTLGDIFEKESFIELEELSIECLLGTLG